MRALFKILMAAAVLFSSAAVIEPGSASAQVRAIYRGGAVRPARVYGPRFAPRPAYARPYYRGYRPAYYGYRRYGYPHRYYRRGYYGAPVAAGLIGGLAIGALANPFYYGPGYYRPYPYYRPAYYGPGTCVIEPRRVVNRYGRLAWRRIQVCY